MKRRQYLLLVVLSVVSGLVGGAVSNRVFMARAAIAQDTKQGDVIKGKLIAAEGFVLLDGNGEPRASFRMVGEDPAIVFMDRKGKMCAVFGLVGGTPTSIFVGENSTITFRDKNGNERACFGLSGITFWDKNGTLRSLLSVSDEGVILSLSDENGKGRAVVSVLSEGVCFSLSDENGKGRAGVSVFSDGPCMALYDENSKLRTALGRTELEVIRTGGARIRAESSLVLFDKDGKVMWSAP